MQAMSFNLLPFKWQHNMVSAGLSYGFNLLPFRWQQNMVSAVRSPSNFLEQNKPFSSRLKHKKGKLS